MVITILTILLEVLMSKWTLKAKFSQNYVELEFEKDKSELPQVIKKLRELIKELFK